MGIVGLGNNVLSNWSTCGFGGKLVRRNSITDIIFHLQSFELELQCLLMGNFGRKEMMLSNITKVSTFS